MTIELASMKDQQNKLDGDSHPSHMKQLTTRDDKKVEAVKSLSLAGNTMPNITS